MNPSRTLTSPGGAGSLFTPDIALTGYGFWRARGNGTTIDVGGMAAGTTVGTATSRTVANTRFATQIKRVGLVSGAVAGDITEHYGAAQWSRGTAGPGGGQGGFIFKARFIPADAATVAGARMFVGLLAGGSALTNVEPTTLTDVVGFAQLSTSTNLHFIYNDASGTASSINLGSNFPCATISVDVYDVVISTSEDRTKIYASVYRANADIAGANPASYFWQVEINSDLPTATTLLSPRVFRTNNATALAAAVDFSAVTVASQF